MTRSNLVLFSGAAVFTVFLFWQLPRALPLIDWGPPDFDFERAVEDVRQHLKIDEVWEIDSIDRFQFFDDRKWRRELGNAAVNRLIAGGWIAHTKVRLKNGSVIWFDPKGRVSFLSIEGSHGEKMNREATEAAIREFVARFYPHRPEAEFGLEDASALARESEISNIRERIRFQFRGERLISYILDYRRTLGEAAEPGFGRFAHRISGAMYLFLLGFCLACFAAFLARLKSEPDAPLTTLLLVSLFLGIAAIISFQGRDGFPYLIEIPIHALFPFLILGLLGYGRSLDVRFNRGAGVASFFDAFRGRLSPVGYGRQLLTGVALLPWSLGVFALTLVLLEIIAPLTLQPQPTDFFLQMFQARQPVFAGSCYFTLIAVLEESVYRLCGALVILRLTKRKWLAIVVPSIFYATAHAGLPFLPPQEPLAFKLIACAAMGCVWGVAYFRFGFLPVLIAHFLCDMTLVFYFFQQKPESSALGIVTMSLILLIPVMLWIGRRFVPKSG